MRRKDREITNSQQIDEVIRKCEICRVGFNDNGKVYIVPLNFGFEHEQGKRIFYFHGANEGRKVDLAQKGGNVCVELETNYKLTTGERAYDFSARFDSVIGNGIVAEIIDDKEKMDALQSIMFHNTGKRGWDINSKEFESVFVFKIELEEISCKHHD